MLYTLHYCFLLFDISEIITLSNDSSISRITESISNCCIFRDYDYEGGGHNLPYFMGHKKDDKTSKKQECQTAFIVCPRDSAVCVTILPDLAYKILCHVLTKSFNDPNNTNITRSPSMSALEVNMSC